jgi:cytochrome c oxidase subunit 3
MAAEPEDAVARILWAVPFPAEVEMLQKRTHPFYVAPLCEYPLLLALSVGTLLASTVPYLHGDGFGPAAEWALVVGATAVARWLRDLEAMASSPASYTSVVRANLLCGVALFIVSEVMVFFGLFWAYLHSALNPAVVLGAIWPPAGLAVLEWYR